VVIALLEAVIVGVTALSVEQISCTKKIEITEVILFGIFLWNHFCFRGRKRYFYNQNKLREHV